MTAGKDMTVFTEVCKATWQAMDAKVSPPLIRKMVDIAVRMYQEDTGKESPPPQA